MDSDDIHNCFDYHPPANQKVGQRHEVVRGMCKTLAFRFNDLLPEGREKSLAVTKLEEAMMWANAAIARHGLPDDKE